MDEEMESEYYPRHHPLAFTTTARPLAATTTTVVHNRSATTTVVHNRSVAPVEVNRAYLAWGLGALFLFLGGCFVGLWRRRRRHQIVVNVYNVDNTH